LEIWLTKVSKNLVNKSEYQKIACYMYKQNKLINADGGSCNEALEDYK